MHDGIDIDIDRLPIVEVSTDSLLAGFSPRLAGCNPENVDRLAELDRPLPPILVLRATNQVIDGMHRLLAARRRGRGTIAVRYFDGDEETAFVLGVRANATHGLPLTLTDRKAAAARLVSRHPEWSNRRIAAVTGLSDKTIAAIRAWAVAAEPAADPGGPARVGLDGRMRPVAAAADRGRAVLAGMLAGDRAGPPRWRGGATRQDGAADLEQGVRTLVKDPALRSTDAGRLLLRTLSALPVIDRNLDSLVDCVPEHDLALLEQLALANAETWRRLAGQVAAARTVGRRGTGGMRGDLTVA